MWFPVGLISSGIALLASFIATGFVTGYYELQASGFFGIVWGIPSVRNFPNYNDQVYVKPYCRIGPYIVGVVLGAIFYYNMKPSFSKHLNHLLYLVLWVVAVFLGMSVAYGVYRGLNDHFFSTAENVIYTMFACTGWGVAVALLVFICHHGYGDPINSFLSMPMWVPLSQLTFNAYLVHPIVLIAVFGSVRDSIYYTDVWVVPIIIGCIVLAYGGAGLVTVAIEFPIANIEI